MNFIKSPKLNYPILIYFIYIAHGMAKFFMWLLHQKEDRSVYCEATVILHKCISTEVTMHIRS